MRGAAVKAVLILTFCFLNYDGSVTEDCERGFQLYRTMTQCEQDRDALPPIVNDSDGRALIDATCTDPQSMIGRPT